MDIGFLTSSISSKAGGIYESMRYLGSELNKNENINISVYGLKDSKTLVDLKGWNGLNVNYHNVLGPDSFGYSPSLTKSLMISNLDLIHSHGIWMYPSVSELNWSKKFNRPYIISPHGMLDTWAIKNGFWKKRIAKVIYENKHLNNAKCFHALCQSEYESIRNLGIKSPIAIIPNGINTQNSLINRSDEENWNQMVPNNRKVLLFLGRLHPKKGLIKLIEAWSIAHKNEKNYSSKWFLVIAGWGEDSYTSSLHEMIRELKVENSVKIIGPQFGKEKDLCLKKASAFVLPSLSEGLPMSVLEAWSYSLPTLITDECNLTESFNLNAALRIGSSTNLILTGLQKLYNMDENELLLIGNNAYELAKKKYNWNIISDSMKLLYEWLLNKNDVPDFVNFK